MTGHENQPSSRFEGRTVIVTGAASGIGLATSLAFMLEGAHVMMLDRDQERLDVFLQEFILNPGIVHGEKSSNTYRHPSAFLCDVSSEESIKNTIQKIVELTGNSIDTLVNVAGVDIIAPLHKTELDRWTRTIDVNLTSVFLMCKYCMPYLENSKYGGAIVNTSSIQANRAFANFPAYAATKGGINAFTRQIASDYAHKNVRVNVVCPGLVSTNLTENSLLHESELPAIDSQGNISEDASGRKDISQDELVKKVLDEVTNNVKGYHGIKSGTDSNRPFTSCTAMQIAMPILFLASREASAMTGIEVPVDNGFSIKGVCFKNEGDEVADCDTICVGTSTEGTVKPPSTRFKN